MKLYLTLAVGLVPLACQRPIAVPAANPIIEGSFFNTEVAIASILSDTLFRAKFLSNMIDFEYADAPKVSLYSEYLDLFNPDKFNCGLGDAVKKRLSRVKPENRDTMGFIPQAILSRGLLSDSVHVFDKKGIAYLTHGFTYKQLDGKFSNLEYALDAPTAQESFDIRELVETRMGGSNNFAYTCDCSGYLSAGLSSSGSGGFLGIGRLNIESSASKAVDAELSLVVFGGYVYNALHAAYRGKRYFASNDSVMLATRIKVLQSIFNELPPNVNDTIVIKLTQQYLAVFAANNGSKSFNGKAELAVGSGFSLGGYQADGNIRAAGSVSRSSEFASYKTFIIVESEAPKVDLVTVKAIRDTISTISTRLTPQ